MSKQDRLNWIAKGSPFELMRPARAVRDRLRAHGYTVYDIGNRQHLEHEPPEDHTPYSETGYPKRAKYGIGYAADIMPPKPGQRSMLNGKVLPTLQQLGAQILKDRKAGVRGISWLKYMNWEPEADGRGPCYHESWQPNYRRTNSTDRGHIHASALTGFEESDIGDDYDPVERFYGEDTDVSKQDVIDATQSSRPFVSAGVAKEAKAAGWGPISDRALWEYTWSGVTALTAQVTALTSVVNQLGAAIQAGGGSVDTAAILSGVRDALADLAEGGAEQVRAG